LRTGLQNIIGYGVGVPGEVLELIAQNAKTTRDMMPGP